MRQKTAIQFGGTTVFWCTTSTACAHTGLDISGLTAGLTHPLSGFDHLLAMLAVGLWAAQTGGDKIWLLPAAFVLSLALGAGFTPTYPSLTMVEPGIAASVLILGLLIALSLKLSALLSLMLTVLFGFLHGYAHGLEMPEAAAPAAYAIGFLSATIALHLTGIVVGVVTRRRLTYSVRTMGAGIAVSGFWMALHL
jgi:urease accessory protein